MVDNCLFCKMVSGEIKPDTVYEDDHVLAFRDINPQAPVHILIIPKVHITSLNDLRKEDAELSATLLLVAGKIANVLGVAADGYRTVINTNRNGGQTVFHMHVHLLAGRPMTWPPG